MATSKLQRIVGDLLDRKLPEFRIRENYRPDWLISSDHKRLELDFYIEEIKIGIEVQGQQHYQYVEFFHRSQEFFEERKRLDREKIELCDGLGIRLVEVFSELDAILIVDEIESKTRPLHPYSYHFPIIHTASFDNLFNSFILRKNEHYDLYYNITKRTEVKHFIKKAQRLYFDGTPEKIREFKFNNLNREEIRSVWDYVVSIS